MIRSALIALDGSDASKIATKLAIRFANEPRVSSHTTAPLLTGIAVLDAPTITQPQGTPLGAGGLKKERDETLLAAADQTTQKVIAEFEAECKAAGVEFATIRPTGLPYEAISRQGHVHDLIVIGRNTNFHFQTSDTPGETFKHLIREHPCPLIITPDELPQGANVVIAYDGSQTSSRALHTFAHLELNLDGFEVHVVSVNADKMQAENCCTEAANFLQRHAITAQAHAVVSDKDCSVALLEKVESLGTQLLVMGAYGNSGIQSFFFGSTTRRLIDECRFPLFVY